MALNLQAQGDVAKPKSELCSATPPMLDSTKAARNQLFIFERYKVN